MGVLEDLKAKYPWHNVPPYGDCIVVGISDWQEQWDAELRLQNVRPISSTFKGLPAYLIPLKGLSRDMRERPTSTPAQAAARERQVGRAHHVWQLEEDAQIIDLWNKHVSAPKIAKLLPKWPEKAIRAHVTELIVQGKIKPRWKKGAGKRSRKAAEKAEAKPEVPEKSPESLTGVPDSKIRDALTRLSKLLKETTIFFHDSSKPYGFKWHCPKCGVSGEAKCTEVWRVCQICGSLLFVWDVE